MSLKDIANLAMSSSPRTGMRSLRRPSANLTAILDADRTGMTTCRDTRIAMAARSPSRTSPPVKIVPRTSETVFSSLVRGKTRYSSRPGMSEFVGLPMMSAGLWCPLDPVTDEYR